MDQNPKFREIIDACFNTHHIDVKENCITWRSEPSDPDDGADYFEWEFDGEGVSVTAIRRDGSVLTGWCYEPDVNTPEQLEKAIEDFDNNTEDWA